MFGPAIRPRPPRPVPSVVLISALLCANACVTSQPRPAPGPPDVIVADFEQAVFEGFETEGAAFGNGPQIGPRQGQDRVTGFVGAGYLSSHAPAGPQGTGRMVSDPFLIDRPYLNLLVGGRYNPQRIRIELQIDGKTVKSTTGNAGPNHWIDHLAPVAWDVAVHRGQQGVVVIIDEDEEKAGHVLVDQIVLSQRPATYRNLRDTALAQANMMVAKQSVRTIRDPLRPIFHVMPAAQWMNDPTGLVFHNGYYHVFFQHNPFGDQWNNMHWGHVRSRDLVTWERLPIALWPSLDRGEAHCDSGCAISRPDGTLSLFYTSLGLRGPQQWRADARDAEGIEFEKVRENPVVPYELHGDLAVEQWRDPFIFQDNKVWYMAIAGRPKGGTASVLLYRSPDLNNWTFVGIPISGKERDWQAPAFVKFGARWLFIYSPMKPARYMVGQLDLESGTFVPEQEGIVDPGQGPNAKEGHFYAPKVLTAPDGRQLMFGWVRGFPQGRGWNGALSVPRVLTLTPGGKLRQNPAKELQALRGREATIRDTPLKESTLVWPEAAGDHYELRMRVELGDSKRAGVKLLRAPNGGRAFVIGYDGERLLVDDQMLWLSPGPDRPPGTIDLQIFVDGSVIEIFANDGAAAITRTYFRRRDEIGVEFFSAGGQANFRDVHSWPLRSIWNTKGP